MPEAFHLFCTYLVEVAPGSSWMITSANQAFILSETATIYFLPFKKRNSGRGLNTCDPRPSILIERKNAISIKIMTIDLSICILQQILMSAWFYCCLWFSVNFTLLLSSRSVVIRTQPVKCENSIGSLVSDQKYEISNYLGDYLCFTRFLRSQTNLIS